METNKLILACLITLCSLPVAAQVKLGIEAGANLSNYITDSHSNPSDSKNMKVVFVLKFIWPRLAMRLKKNSKRQLCSFVMRPSVYTPVIVELTL